MKIFLKKEKNRAYTQVNGYEAYVEYIIDSTSLDIIHTIVPKPIEGMGIAWALVKFVYDYTLEQGLNPKATCSYAKTWLLRHPEYTK